MFNFIVLMQPQQEGEGGGYSFLIMMALLILVFYFFMIRPQVKKQKQIKNFRENLNKGDKVITVGGIYGKIVDIQESSVILQVDDNTKLKVDKGGLVKDPADMPAQK